MHNRPKFPTGAFITLYLCCAAVELALCLIFYPLLEFSWLRATGIFILIIFIMLIMVIRNTIRRHDKTKDM